jgi:hypothetical protein
MHAQAIDSSCVPPIFACLHPIMYYCHPILVWNRHCHCLISFCTIHGHGSSLLLQHFHVVGTDTNVGCENLDKICMMTTRLARNRAIESSYWRMDNNSDVGLLMGYVLYRLPIELESMDLDTFPVDLDCTLLCSQVDRTRYSSIASGNNCIVQLCKCVSLHL